MESGESAGILTGTGDSVRSSYMGDVQRGEIFFPPKMSAIVSVPAGSPPSTGKTQNAMTTTTFTEPLVRHEVNPHLPIHMYL